MSFATSVDRLAKRVTRSLLAVGIVAGLAALTPGGPTAAADDEDEISQTESTETGAGMSRRERRREERRRAQIEAAEAELAAIEAEANAASEDGRPVFAIAVEPEMECETVRVTGSRMPKRVCKPVGMRESEEATAEEFLRRTRELSTLSPPGDEFIRTSPPGFPQ